MILSPGIFKTEKQWFFTQKRRQVNSTTFIPRIMPLICSLEILFILFSAKWLPLNLLGQTVHSFYSVYFSIHFLWVTPKCLLKLMIYKVPFLLIHLFVRLRFIPSIKPSGIVTKSCSAEYFIGDTFSVISSSITTLVS